MAGIKDYDGVTAVNNSDAPPDGAPEGMDANTVNNTMREMMLNIKNTPFTVLDLTALKALDITLQTDDSLIALTGLTTAGTQGGLFRYDLASSASTDDIDIVQPTTGVGRWIRVTLYDQSLKTTDDVNFDALGLTSTLTSNIPSGDNIILQKLTDQPSIRWDGVSLNISIGINSSNNLEIKDNGGSAITTFVNSDKSVVFAGVGDFSAAGIILEGGNWSPVISDGTNDATMSIQVGTFQIIGNVVHAQCRVASSALGSVSGPIRITGLPRVSSSTGNNKAGIAAGQGGGLNLAVAGHTVAGFVEVNSTFIALEVWDSTAGTTPLDALEWSSNGNLILSVEYNI